MWHRSVVRCPENEDGGAASSTSLPRRGLLLGGFLASLAAAYGLFATFAVQFVFPKRKAPRRSRIFVGFESDLGPGESKAVNMPTGDQVLISNTGRINAETGNTFAAFSNSCPHLGCKVHWEAQNNRFYCPCHQGVFSPEGEAVSGPPAQSGSNLRPYEIEVEGNSIYAILGDV
jgi:cytochrome b6-f complex iron-sulfur subunit